MEKLTILLAGYLAEQAKDTPHLGGSSILRHGRSQWIKKTTEQQFLSQLGLAYGQDFPLAQLLQCGEHIEQQLATCWVAQPVNMQLQRDTFCLTQPIALKMQEFEALSVLLNDHFRQENIVFTPNKSNQYWFLHTPNPIKAESALLQTVLGQNVQRFQPTGVDAAQLRRVMNETQMLLHEHPINQQRVAEHLPEINSVWVYGGGMLIEPPAQLPVAIGGNGTLLNGLSTWLKQPALANLQAALESGAKEAVMFYENTTELDWSALFQQVKFGKIKQFNLYFPQGHQTCHTVLNTLDGWKFWRKAVDVTRNATEST
jgi:hypothetical protein